MALIGLFWTFSYVLLSIRGAILHDDWGRLIDDNRLLAVTVGAAAYALVLRHLDAGHRLTLSSAVVWIAGATLAVMVVRVTLDQLTFDVPQGLGLNLLWSLTWSAYFGLWVMASLAFAPPAVAAPTAQSKRVEVIASANESQAAKVDSLELMIIAIMAEAADLRDADRAVLAARVLALGGYESIDGSPRDNERARLALRMAARLADRAR
jgi:hypothetical protein